MSPLEDLLLQFYASVADREKGVAFIDQNFGKTVPGIELSQVEKVSDLIKLIGEGLID